MSVTLTVQLCSHENRSFLGTDGATYFFRCDTCHDVLIAQGGHVWRLQAIPR